MKLDIWVFFFWKSVKKFQVSLKYHKNKCNFHEDQYVFFITYHSFILRMGNVSNKIGSKNLNAHCRPNNVPFFFFKSCHLWDMWKNIVEPDRPQMKIWLMQIACWTPKATSTHSEYVIIISLPLQLWSHERTAVLRYTFIARLFIQFSALQGVSESCTSVFAQLLRSTTQSVTSW